MERSRGDSGLDPGVGGAGRGEVDGYSGGGGGGCMCTRLGSAPAAGLVRWWRHPACGRRRRLMGVLGQGAGTPSGTVGGGGAGAYAGGGGPSWPSAGTKRQLEAETGSGNEPVPERGPVLRRHRGVAGQAQFDPFAHHDFGHPFVPSGPAVGGSVEDRHRLVEHEDHRVARRRSELRQSRRGFRSRTRSWRAAATVSKVHARRVAIRPKSVVGGLGVSGGPGQHHREGPTTSTWPGPGMISAPGCMSNTVVSASWA